MKFGATSDMEAVIDLDSMDFDIHAPKVPIATIETITPAIAERMLERNIRNRPFKERKILKYADKIRNGLWQLNGETIKLDSEGYLLDGQNRLAAVVRTKMPINTFVICGIGRECFDTIDCGTKRSHADTLSVDGQRYAKVKSTALKYVDQYFNRSGDKPFSRSLDYENDEILELSRKYSDIDQSVSNIYKYSGSFGVLGMPASIQSALHYLFVKINGAATTPDLAEDAADMFFERLNTGAGLISGSPILTLRNRLIAENASRRQLPKYLLIAFTIKSWNAFIEGRKMSRLAFIEEGPTKEAYPTIK